MASRDEPATTAPETAIRPQAAPTADGLPRRAALTAPMAALLPARLGGQPGAGRPPASGQPAGAA